MTNTGDSSAAVDGSSAGKAKGWTDAEKVALLLSIVISQGPTVNWKAVQLPEGRTQKACTHALDKMRKEVLAAGIIIPSPDKKRKGSEPAEANDTTK